MGAAINTLSTSYGDDYFYESNFLYILKSFIPTLRAGKVNIVTPSNHQLYKYEGDFYGLLDDLGLGKEYFYATLLLNNLTSSADFKSSISSIIMPDTGLIDSLHATYTTLVI